MTGSLRRKLKQMNRFQARSAEERVQQILDERTERLASRPGATAQAGVLPRVLICGGGRERFGIPVEAVAEVLPHQKCMPVPDGPPALVGLFGRNGRLVSVVDLAVALGIESASAGQEDQHFVLLRHGPPQIALRVDRAYTVADVLPLGGDETTGFRSDAVIGHAKAQSGFTDADSLLSLLDINRLLRSFLPSSPVPGV